MDALIVFDFLVDDLKLCFDLRLNGRCELIDKIIMKNRGDYSSFSFPVLTFSESNASIIEEPEDFRKQGMFLKLDGVNHEILDNFGVDRNDLETCECVTDDQIVLGNFFLENFERAIVLFYQFEKRQAHEFVGQLKDFVAELGSSGCKALDSLFWLVVEKVKGSDQGTYDK